MKKGYVSANYCYWPLLKASIIYIGKCIAGLQNSAHLKIRAAKQMSNLFLQKCHWETLPAKAKSRPEEEKKGISAIIAFSPWNWHWSIFSSCDSQVRMQTLHNSYSNISSALIPCDSGLQFKTLGNKAFFRATSK